MSTNAIPSFSTATMIELAHKCQSNLNHIAQSYSEAIKDNSALRQIEAEREEEIQRVMQRYEAKMEEARFNSPQVREMKVEAARQINAYRGCMDNLRIFSNGKLSLEPMVIPDVFAFIAENPDSVSAPIRSAKVDALPSSDYQPYLTISSAIKEMFMETNNAPVKPMQIIKYLKDKKGIGHAEASIRTQLHGLKREKQVLVNKEKKYSWIFSKKEQSEMAKNLHSV